MRCWWGREPPVIFGYCIGVWQLWTPITLTKLSQEFLDRNNFQASFLGGGCLTRDLSLQYKAGKWRQVSAKVMQSDLQSDPLSCLLSGVGSSLPSGEAYRFPH